MLRASILYSILIFGFYSFAQVHYECERSVSPTQTQGASAVWGAGALDIGLTRREFQDFGEGVTAYTESLDRQAYAVGVCGVEFDPRANCESLSLPQGLKLNCTNGVSFQFAVENDQGQMTCWRHGRVVAEWQVGRCSHKPFAGI